MSRIAYRYTPAQLLALLRSNRFSFLTNAARERIDALMEVVTFDVSDHAKHCDEHLRWDVLDAEARSTAMQRLAVCHAVYEYMVAGATKQQAVYDLLQEGQKSKGECRLSDMLRYAIRELGLKPDFGGVRRVQIWTDRMQGQKSVLAQMLALTDEEALAISEDRYLERLIAAGMDAPTLAGA